VKKLLSCALLALVASPAFASSFTSKTTGGRTYWLFVPTSYSAGTPAPLIVMLHGCTQNGDGFATSTGMNAVAEADGFLVAYPVQPSSANSSQCWNWFLTAHQARGAGEPASLAGVVTHVKSQYSIDNAKVFAAGFSAGAAMASILGATYPDVFAAIGVHSGLEYKAATTQTAAFTAMSSGGPDPTTAGNQAYTAMGAQAQLVPVMVFHGTSDFTVATTNGNQVISQWAQTNDRASDGADNQNIDDVAESLVGGQVPGGRTYSRSVYQDSAGNVVMEKYLVDSMGHNWSGGVLGGTYTDPNGPKASEILADFFLGTTPGGGGPGDTTPPVTTAAPAGGTYTAAVNVALSVNESATTFYTVNGSAPTTGSAIYSSPIAIAVNTTLRYFSVDTAGNAEALRQQVYVINPGGGGGGTNVTLTSIDAEDGFVGQLVADGVSNTTHKVGDKGMYNVDTFRLMLSFNTGAVPAGATITRARLTVFRQSLTGTVPSLTIDAADLFGAAALAQSDYSAAADVANAATLAIPAANGASTYVDLPASVYPLILSGKLQLRLKAATTANFTSDQLNVYGGSAGASAPTLQITY
jgi:poly(hydroxyalkanoate) depolymerase family esterase